MKNSRTSTFFCLKWTLAVLAIIKFIISMLVFVVVAVNYINENKVVETDNETVNVKVTFSIN